MQGVTHAAEMKYRSFVPGLKLFVCLPVHLHGRYSTECCRVRAIAHAARTAKGGVVATAVVALCRLPLATDWAPGERIVLRKAVITNGRLVAVAAVHVVAPRVYVNARLEGRASQRHCNENIHR